MSTLNYIVPTGSMTLTDQKAYRQAAVAAGIERAADKGIGNIRDEIPGVNVNDRQARVNAILKYLETDNIPPSIDVREFQPILDAGTALDQWNTAALAVVGTAYSCFQAIAAPVMAANRLAVFYKVGIETVPLPVSRLIFRSGGAAGNIIGEFDLEQLVNRLETDGYLSEPVVIDPTGTFAAQVLCRIATGVLARVQLGGLIFEPAGSTIA
ncbi:MAG: hypothetical protein PHQ43_14595 [Dehalococcoidales bacterium]|nr:hypothetical protein [Dehalococcoidales bacterium]